MARIAGVTIPESKRLEIALSYIYGVGRPLARTMMVKAQVQNKKVKELTSDELGRVRKIIETQYIVEGELRRKIMMNIKHLKDSGTYRGMRHARKLPVRGQRTRTNSRTVRGNVRRTMASGKRKVEKK